MTYVITGTIKCDEYHKKPILYFLPLYRKSKLWLKNQILKIPGARIVLISLVLLKSLETKS